MYSKHGCLIDERESLAMPMDRHDARHHAKHDRDPLAIERAAFWQELACAVAILGPIVSLVEIGVWILW